MIESQLNFIKVSHKNETMPVATLRYKITLTGSCRGLNHPKSGYFLGLRKQVLSVFRIFTDQAKSIDSLTYCFHRFLRSSVSLYLRLEKKLIYMQSHVLDQLKLVAKFCGSYYQLNFFFSLLFASYITATV